MTSRSSRERRSSSPGGRLLRAHAYRDVATASRHPETFLSGPGAVSLMDLPSEMVEYFSGMISTDNPKHARLRRIVSNAFNPRNVARHGGLDRSQGRRDNRPRRRQRLR